MKKIIVGLVCVLIPMLISTVAQQIWGFSDYIMMTIYFVLFALFFFIAKKTGNF